MTRSSKKIILVVSTSRGYENATRAAMRRARKDGAEILVALVVDTQFAQQAIRDLQQQGWVGPEPSEKLEGALIEECETFGQDCLDRIRDLLAGQDIHLECIVRRGDFVRETVRLIKKHRADLLILPRRKRSSLSRFFLGSAVQEIRSASRCPVMIVDEDEG